MMNLVTVEAVFYDGVGVEARWEPDFGEEVEDPLVAATMNQNETLTSNQPLARRLSSSPPPGLAFVRPLETLRAGSSKFFDSIRV
ncbi:hypothetical protein LWI28_021178 [Acer negundo]|uniref:Uncharacterized protein n=1 Tax=Acer negundo TaxID=4023 RepID=A0AAD5JAK5_ACENE|nr:hypothetical protein LWI28_021178 [Acer negundo]